MKKKLSEVTYQDLEGQVAHYDCSDMQMVISADNIEEWREGLMEEYGDMIVDIDTTRRSFDVVKFECERLNNDIRAYIDKKFKALEGCSLD